MSNCRKHSQLIAEIFLTNKNKMLLKKNIEYEKFYLLVFTSKRLPSSKIVILFQPVLTVKWFTNTILYWPFTFIITFVFLTPGIILEASPTKT